MPACFPAVLPRLVAAVLLLLSAASSRPAGAQDLIYPGPPPQPSGNTRPAVELQSPIPVLPIDDKTYLNSVPAGFEGLVYPHLKDVVKADQKEDALKKLGGFAGPGATVIGELVQALRRRTRGRIASASAPKVLQAVRELTQSRDLRQVADYHSLMASDPNRDIEAVSKNGSCARIDPVLNRLLLDEALRRHEVRLLSRSLHETIAEELSRHFERYGDTPLYPHYVRQLLEVAGSEATARNRMSYGPQLDYSNYNARTDVSYQHLFGERESDTFAVRVDLTGWPRRNMEAQSAIRDRYPWLDDPGRGGEHRREKRPAVSEVLAALSRVMPYARAARVAYTRGALSTRAALVALYHRFTNGAGDGRAGVSVSRLFALHPRGPSAGIALRASLFGAWSEQRDGAALQSAVALVWQDRVPITRSASSGYSAKDGAPVPDSVESWRWRVGVEVKPFNALVPDTTVDGFVRYHDQKGQREYSVVLGESPDHQLFVGLRLGQSIRLD